MNYYKTGQFAKLANVSERTIRYYDKIGLLKPSFVMENGYRQYSDLDLLKLQKILSLKHLGFSIEEIFPMVMDNTNLKESFELQIDLIEDKISHLQSLKDALKSASQSSDLSWNMILSLVQLSNEETNIIEGLALPHHGGGIAPDYGLCFWCDRQRQRGGPLCI